MHLLLIGATGRNGRFALDAALANSHTVTALIRESSKSKLPQHPNLTVVYGSASSSTDLAKALTTPSPPQAIISTLNLRRVSESPFAAPSPDSPNDLLIQSMRALVEAIQSTSSGQTPKIVINSMQGVGDSAGSLIWPIRALFHHSNMTYTLDGHEELDAFVRGSGLNFVLARAARLTERGEEKADLNKVKVLSDNGKGAGWMASVAREELALWLVKAAESNEWDGRSPVLVN